MTDAAKHDTRDAAIELILHGLTTDGAHHKQWALERALRVLCEDSCVDKAKAEFGWEEGIAP